MKFIGPCSKKGRWVLMHHGFGIALWEGKYAQYPGECIALHVVIGLARSYAALYDMVRDRGWSCRGLDHTLMWSNSMAVGRCETVRRILLPPCGSATVAQRQCLVRTILPSNRARVPTSPAVVSDVAFICTIDHKRYLSCLSVCVRYVERMRSWHGHGVARCHNICHAGKKRATHCTHSHIFFSM